MIYRFGEGISNEMGGDKDYVYAPIVGDSFTGDTPLFIKYKKDTDSIKKGWVDIKPIEEIIDEDTIEKDFLNREYDYSEKPYWVLCRSGWCDCKYVYRHKTDKNIYRVSDNNGMIVDVTEDHSLYDKNQKPIKPTNITNETELEYYNDDINSGNGETTLYNIDLITKEVIYGIRDRFPTYFLNLNKENSQSIVDCWNSHITENKEFTKTIQAQIQYIKNKIK
jgi:rhodanese-related sulfurtransferase